LSKPPTVIVGVINRIVVSLLVLSLASLLICDHLAYPQPYDEYQVKAVFLNKLPVFIKWPEPIQESDQIVIGVLGANPFKAYTKDIEGQSVRGKRVIVKQIMTPREAKQCHVVFIGPSEKDRLSYILSTLSSSSVLTVSDSEGWSKQGVMINFYVEHGSIRFEVNMDAAKSAGLAVSSQLLKLARIQR
jgi:hypothetical protein